MLFAGVAIQDQLATDLVHLRSIDAQGSGLVTRLKLCPVAVWSGRQVGDPKRVEPLAGPDSGTDPRRPGEASKGLERHVAR